MDAPIDPSASGPEQAVIANFHLGGGGEVALYAYGTDAEALFKVMEPALRGLVSSPSKALDRASPLPDRVVGHGQTPSPATANHASG